MAGIKFEPPAQSRNEAILEATLNGTAYTDPTQSRIEDLLLQLKAAIEAGGGGDVTALVTRVKAIEDQLYSTISGVPTNTDTGSMDLSSVDLDTVTTSGFYNAMTCSNAPSSYCTLIVIGYDLSGYCTQIAADVTTGKLYARTQINGTWGAWGEKVSAQDLAAVATSGSYSDLTGRPNLAAVATSGAYSDLNGTPTIDTALSASSTNAVQNKVVNAALATKANASALTAETTARENADTALRTEINGKASIDDIYGVKPTIPSGTDLNTMLTPGAYACGGATLAASLVNCPTTTDAFIMYVDNIAATSRIIQRLYAMNTSTGIPCVYIRALFSAGWGAWYKFEGTGVT